jgi:hypothetical protein
VKNFTQIISIQCADPDTLVELATMWDDDQATADVMGYIGTQVLASREVPGEFLIVAEFASVDPEVPAEDEAAKNNDRPETQEWARRLRAVIQGEPAYRHYDEIYRTGI